MFEFGDKFDGFFCFSDKAQQATRYTKYIKNIGIRGNTDRRKDLLSCFEKRSLNLD